MAFEQKDPMAELEEIARQAANQMIVSIARGAKSEEEAQELVGKVIDWMRNQLDQVQWSTHINRLAVDPALSGKKVGQHPEIDLAAKHSPSRPADIRADESSSFLSLLSQQPEDSDEDNPTRPFTYTPRRRDKDHE